MKAFANKLKRSKTTEKGTNESQTSDLAPAIPSAMQHSAYQESQGVAVSQQYGQTGQDLKQPVISGQRK